MGSRNRSQSDVIPWSKVVEKLHKNKSSSKPLKIRVSAINELADREDFDFRVGDELYVYDAKTKAARLSLSEKKNPGDEEIITVPLHLESRFKVLPHFDQSRVFNSIADVLDIYPAIDDVIYPLTSFNIDGIPIQDWDRLQVLTKVHDPNGVESLEIKTERHGTKILLPSNLDTKFIQMQADPLFPMAEPLSLRKYSMKELVQYWNPQMEKLKIRLICKEDKVTSPSAASTTPMGKLKGFFGKGGRASTVTDEPRRVDDHWMIPTAWRDRVIEMEPVKTIHAMKCSLPGSELTISGSFKMDVTMLDFDESDEQMFKVGKGRPRTSVSSEGSAGKLQELNLESMMHPSKSSYALTACVTSGATASLSQKQNPIRHGNTIAVHRARRVRKLLLTSPEMQHYLVTPNYSGVFTTIPFVYDRVGDISATGEAKYVTKLTSYPREQVLSPCREGEIVQFIKKANVTQVNGTTVQVTHCMVSASPNLPPHAVTYPDYLQGKFEPIDQSETKELRARDLFTHTLPCHVRLQAGDEGLGFDPLCGRKSFIVQEVISEITAIVGSARVEPGTKNQLIEVPTCRGSLTIAPAEAGNVPIAASFNGLEKLPTVEIITHGDVESLRKANKMSTPTAKKKNGDGKTNEEPQYIRAENVAQDFQSKTAATFKLGRPPLPREKPRTQTEPPTSPFAAKPCEVIFEKKDDEDYEIPPNSPNLNDPITEETEETYTKMDMSPVSYSQVTPKSRRQLKHQPFPVAQNNPGSIDEEPEADFGENFEKIKTDENDKNDGYVFVQPETNFVEEPDYLRMDGKTPVPKPRTSLDKGTGQPLYDTPRPGGPKKNVIKEATSDDDDDYVKPNDFPYKVNNEEIPAKPPAVPVIPRKPSAVPAIPRKPTVYRNESRDESDC